MLDHIDPDQQMSSIIHSSEMRFIFRRNVTDTCMIRVENHLLSVDITDVSVQLFDVLLYVRHVGALQLYSPSQRSHPD